MPRVLPQLGHVRAWSSAILYPQLGHCTMFSVLYTGLGGVDFTAPDSSHPYTSESAMCNVLSSSECAPEV